jgi:hypothetical protein
MVSGLRVEAHHFVAHGLDGFHDAQAFVGQFLD